MGTSTHLRAIEPALEPLRKAAGDLGASAWLVGGYVRDRLLGRPHPDIDVVVEDDRALDLARRFAQLTGSPEPIVFERFGTAQVRWEDRLVEFASARAESYAPDSRKPDVRPAGLDDDLLRRDFTVNTLLMDLEGRIEDRLGSARADLGARLLRTPLDPAKTFDDDPLRMLRAIRFAAQLGFKLDRAMVPAMRRMKERLRPPVVSVERVGDELRKMLLTERPSIAIDLLNDSELLEVVLPEVAACWAVRQGGWHTHDVYGHTVLTVDHTPPELTTRLAALLHDIGKPATAAPDGSFHGHDVVGAQMAEDVLRRLRFSHDEAARVAHLVKLHLRPVYYESEWTDGAVRRLARDAGPELWRLLDLARADIAASAYPHPEKLDELERRLRTVLSEQPTRLELPVTGQDIMRERGLEPGPEVGRIKDRLQELVTEGLLEPTREAVLAYLRANPEL